MHAACIRRSDDYYILLRFKCQQASGPRPTDINALIAYRWDEWSTSPCTSVFEPGSTDSTRSIASTSYTQPPHVPPPSCCNKAHRRVSSGRSGSGCKGTAGERAARIFAPSSDENVRVAGV